MLRRIVPASLKRQFKIAQRVFSDFKSGTRGRFARQHPGQLLTHSLSLSQPILNATSEQSRINKIYNIKIAAESIETLQINPGEIFSFWHIVGTPSARNNFKPGINIINGQIIEDFGGGLCQLSGIIYHLSLIAGLTVLERSNHSVDLYNDSERYTPLGADCAVFYGYKDLRLQNDHDQPIRFRFEVTDKNLICYLDSAEEIAPRRISFERLQGDQKVTTVATMASGKVIAHSNYQKPATTAAAPYPPPAAETGFTELERALTQPARKSNVNS